MFYFVKNVMKFLRELLRTLILMAYGMRNPMRSGELQENRTGIFDYRIAGTYLFSRPYLKVGHFYITNLWTDTQVLVLFLQLQTLFGI